ncbi:hypothetical protein L1887_22582 [Cichorium endivia]|nr:hypothetical protein L1887_22582 [Cichorium endivia]
MSDSTAIVSGGFDCSGSISDSNNFGLQLLIDCNSDSDTSPPEAPPRGVYSQRKNLPKSIPITRLGQCHETNSFKSNFASWSSASTAPVPEETRGKVAVPPLLAENGKFEMWRIDGEEKTPLPKEDIGKFYCGDCYVCLYSYHSNEKKEDHCLCCWFGKDRSEGRMYHGKEAPQFVAIFQPMVILKVLSFALVVVMMYLCFDIIALEF